MRLAEICKELESMNRAGVNESSTLLLSLLEGEYESFCQFLLERNSRSEDAEIA